MDRDKVSASGEELAEIGKTAKGLSRNPLGIIALFIVLIYGFASLVVGFSGHLESSERAPIIWFLVLFPVAVLAAFCWLVSKHHQKLYAPKDFASDDSFLQGVAQRASLRDQIVEIDNQVHGKIKERLTSQSLIDALAGSAEDVRAKLAQTAEDVAREVRDASSVVVDARQFTHSGVAWHSLPLTAFRTFGELTDELYFLLQEHVGPFEYGQSWILKNRRTNLEIRGARSIIGAPSKQPVEDNRTLSEVDIRAGDIVEVVRPAVAQPG